MSLEYWLLVGVVTGSIGMGYVVYGRRQEHPPALVCGILLMAYPYFLQSLVWTLVIGAVLVLLPFLIRVG